MSQNIKNREQKQLEERKKNSTIIILNKNLKFLMSKMTK